MTSNKVPRVVRDCTVAGGAALLLAGIVATVSARQPICEGEDCCQKCTQETAPYGSPCYMDSLTKRHKWTGEWVEQGHDMNPPHQSTEWWCGSCGLDPECPGGGGGGHEESPLAQGKYLEATTAFMRGDWLAASHALERIGRWALKDAIVQRVELRGCSGVLIAVWQLDRQQWADLTAE